MRRRYVWLVCGLAVIAVELLRALALQHHSVSGEALESLQHTLYLVAGIGAGRLEVSGHLRRAVWAGLQTGGITGLIGCSASQGLAWALELEPVGTMIPAAVALLVICAVTVLTAATLGALGGIAGWGVRRAVDPAA